MKYVGESALKKLINLIKAKLDTKVDKVSGKGLSTNDYTAAEKQNVANNTTARHSHSNKNVLDQITGIVSEDNISSPAHISDLVDYSGFLVGSQQIINQIPTRISDLTNDLVCQTSNYGDKTVTGAKVADATLTTSKYANASVTQPIIAVGATHTDATITLTSAGWSNNLQTVNVTGVTASNLVIVASDPNYCTAYGNAGVLCSAQASGKLTFKCESTPTQDLVVNITMPR